MNPSTGSGRTDLVLALGRIGASEGQPPRSGSMGGRARDGASERARETGETGSHGERREGRDEETLREFAGREVRVSLFSWGD